MSLLWKDGAILSAAEPAIAADDRGFLLGDGLFETVKALAGRPLRWTRHMARLRAGAALLELPLAWTDEALLEAATALLARNGLADAVLRLTLTRGPGERGLLPPTAPRPTTLLTTAPLPAPAGATRAILAETVRRNEHSILARVKSLNYLEGVVARMEARRRGADDALLRNLAGRLAEASAANLFLVEAGRLATPPVGEGALAGTMRAELMALATVEERPLEVASLAAASEAFLANSLGLRPLVAVDDARIGGGAPGPVTRELQTAVAALERAG
jgi:branched-chain amino acid aminotransferase